MVLAIIASYFYSKGITKPLLHINTSAENITKLDFSHKCIVYTKDEIGDLAQNINIMSEELQKTLDDLNGANKKLKENIELKEKMEHMRKRFIANASHELKTPLTVMNGICEGLLDGIYDRNDNQYFKQILNEIVDMQQFVYELLEISKIDAGELPLNKEVFQLSDVILKVHDKLKILIENQEINY